MEKSWGYCKNKTENQRQEAQVQILKTLENSWLQGTLNDRRSSNAYKLTLKPNTTQEPTSSRERHTMQILQQHRNVALSSNKQAAQSHTKPSDISKLDTSVHSREKKSRSTHQNTDTSFPNQETLTSHSSNPTHSKEPPQ